MNEGSEAIVRWLEQKRRAGRASAAVLSLLALGSGVAVFMLTTFLLYTVLAPSAPLSSTLFSCQGWLHWG